MANKVLTEEERKKLSPPIGKPLMTSSVPDSAAPPDMESDSAPTTPPTISGAAPYQPMAPRPQSQAFSDWQASDLAQHPVEKPRYHGLTRALDTIAQMTWPGQAAEVGGEFGTMGAEAKAHRLAGNAQLEEQQIQNTGKEREENIQEEEQKTKTAGEEAGNELVTIQTPTGPIQVMRKNLASPTSAIISAAGRTDVANIGAGAKLEGDRIKALSAELIAAGKPVSMDQLAAAAMQKGDQATVDQIAEYKRKIAAAGKQEPGSFVPVNDAAGNILGWANPKSRDWVPVSDIAGGAPGAAAGGPGGSIPPKPSPIEKRMADLAGYSISLIDDAINMIESAKEELGPVAGRWNQFVSGQLGVKGVTWTGINAQLDYVKGAITLAHSQGRVSNIIYDTFNKMYDAGRQDPDNLLEALRIGKRAMGAITNQFRGEEVLGVVNPTQGGLPSANAAGGGRGAPSQSRPPNPTSPSGKRPSFSEWSGQ